MKEDILETFEFRSLLDDRSLETQCKHYGSEK